MIKSFRGLLADGDTDTIRLGTNTGLTGYKIIKFVLMPYDNTTEDYEAVVKIYKRPQTTATATVNFSNPLLLGAGQWGSSSSSNTYPDDLTVIFDNEIFNQDIYITFQDTKSNSGINYYLELEQVKLDLNEATVATLKDMRGSN